MGAWPDWWPANPVGSAYDEYQEQKQSWTIVFYIIGGLAALILIIYIWRKLK
jgi:hypothetical protein